MGTSLGLGVSKAVGRMRAFVIVFLAVAAVHAEADADAYTLGQVAAGLTHGGVITGVDYANHPVTPVVTPAVHNVATYHHPSTYVNPVNTVYSNVFPNVYSGVYNHHYYGKREAEAEPEADPLVYTNNLVHTGVYNPVTYGTVGTVPAVSHVSVGVPAVNPVHVGVPAVSSYTHTVPVVPAVKTVASTYTTPVNTVYNGVFPNVYSGVYNHHYVGKREAEAEPEADPFVYTNNFVHSGVYNPVTYGTVGTVPAVSHGVYNPVTPYRYFY